MLYTSRNHAIGFARRTRKNLEFVDLAFEQGADVHVVTQLATSLLGLVVFPWEKYFIDQVESVKLTALYGQGWPKWRITLGSCDTLVELIKHVRNAVAHGRITFSSESRYLKEVEITIEDARSGDTEPYWRASIPATDLHSFCIRFADYVDQRIG